MRATLPAAMLLAAVALSAAAQEDDIDPRFGRRMAPAVPAVSLEQDGSIDRKDFDFGRSIGKAWLARKGELKVDIWVQHRGLLCATYEVGIRFGEGSRGCTDVNWLAPVHWITERRQCNNAIIQHVGVDTDEHIMMTFERVTCAERVVRCKGNCK